MTKRVSEGSPEPLGLTLDARGANVAVFSAHASAIDLCLFDSRGQNEIERLRLPCRTGDVFHGHFAGIGAGQRYGLRAHGRYAPSEGHRFNPAKLLADPYAVALDRPFSYSPVLLDYQPGGPSTDLRLDPTDSAPFMPKAIASAPLQAKRPPPARKAWAETSIYELHVRGFTKSHPGVPEAIRGTFAGLAHPAALDHLVRLGITAIEIMPAAAWIDERHLHNSGLTNYWGYSPVTFMAPDPRLAPGGWAEIAASVAAIQAAGIEVLVDVVLNHTGEGDHLGPSVSLRGLDNATYFRLLTGNFRTPINDTGCGNTLALDHPAVVRLAADALRAWAELGGVDGFRYDLATTLGRRDDGFDPAAPLLTAISQDPLLRKLRMIAEPWDLGLGAYRIGAFPASWGEWNDQYRDTMRKFWRGDGWLAGEAATRFSGSSDIFAPRNRPPSRSVNFIVAHDGFTLADLVSYERKHNDANGENGRDGTDVNYSWNNGMEGATGDPAIVAARRKDQRNLLATLLLARGTPMLTMGAEFGHSQGGNNNAYAQDNATSWLNWCAADKTLAAFTARLLEFRASHRALTRDRFLTGEAPDATLIPDAEWRNPDGTPMQPGDWHSERRSLIGSFYAPAEHENGADRVTVVLHAGREALDIILPEARDGYCWRLCIDTAEETGGAAARSFEGGSVLAMAPRSFAALDEVPNQASQRAEGRGHSESRFLDRLASAVGISADWYDIAGAKHIVPADTKEVLLAGMGFAAGSEAQARESLGRLAEEQDRRLLPSTLVVHEGEPLIVRVALRDGRTPTSLLIEREDGSLHNVRLSPSDVEYENHAGIDGRRVDTVLAKLPPEPAGRHRIMLEHAPEIACQLTVAPKRCFLPPGLSSGRRAFGVAGQLYALRRNGDQGIGDFTTLGELARLAAKAGAATVGLNPLHALPSSDRGRVSPYYPSDRRFLDPLYIDVAALRGGCTQAALTENARRIAALSALPEVDYEGVWALKRTVLEAHFADFNDLCAASPGNPLRGEFEAFIKRGGTSLEQFACFEAIVEIRKGEAWPHWPAGLSGRDPKALSAFAEENAGLVRFYLFLQWLANRQLAEAAAQPHGDKSWLGFYCDLAVGAAPDGAEVWSNAKSVPGRGFRWRSTRSVRRGRPELGLACAQSPGVASLGV